MDKKYELYLTKKNKFECEININGTSLSKVEPRMILETKKCSVMFKGKIYDSGVCVVNLTNLEDFFNINDTGIMKLEVVAEDLLFVPWESRYLILN